MNTANFLFSKGGEREKYLIKTHTNILLLNGSKVLNIEIIHNGNGRNGGLRHHLQVIRHHVRHNTLHKTPTTFILASRIRLRRSNIRHLGTNVVPAVRTNSFRVVGDGPAATIPPVAGSTKISEGAHHGTLLAHELDNGPERQRHEVEQEIHEGLLGFGENYFLCLLVYEELQTHA
nr:hypothetical protein Iba_chr05fCG12040 [Ipomoea batatas]